MPRNAGLSGLMERNSISIGSVAHIQKQYPDFRRDSIEEYLIDWIDVDYAPDHYSQAQLDELDTLTARWISDHARRAKTSKKKRKTRHS